MMVADNCGRSSAGAPDRCDRGARRAAAGMAATTLANPMVARERAGSPDTWAGRGRAVCAQPGSRDRRRARVGRLLETIVPENYLGREFPYVVGELIGWPVHFLGKKSREKDRSSLSQVKSNSTSAADDLGRSVDLLRPVAAPSPAAFGRSPPTHRRPGGGPRRRRGRLAGRTDASPNRGTPTRSR